MRRRRQQPQRLPRAQPRDVRRRHGAGVPKLRSGSFFPEDIVERYQRVDRAVVAAVAEMYATGTSTRKVQRVAEKLGISKLSKDQVSAIAKNLDADVAELLGRIWANRARRICGSTPHT